MLMGKCESCRFWDKQSPTSQVGWCRKSSPTVVVLNTLQYAGNVGVQEPIAQTVWPEVYANVWCGEHRAKNGMGTSK